jgi:hypothetical protein
MYGTLACAEHFGAAVSSASAAQKPNLIRCCKCLKLLRRKITFSAAQKQMKALKNSGQTMAFRPIMVFGRFDLTLWWSYSVLYYLIYTHLSSHNLLGGRCAKNRTRRFKFWAVAANKNCSLTFHKRRSLTRPSRMRCLSSANRPSIL